MFHVNGACEGTSLKPLGSWIRVVVILKNFRVIFFNLTSHNWGVDVVKKSFHGFRISFQNVFPVSLFFFNFTAFLRAVHSNFGNVKSNALKALGKR